MSEPNTARPPGTWLMPRRTRASASRYVMSSPAKRIDPAVAAPEPADGPQDRRLAGAVHAEEGHELALAHLEVDPVEHLELAVAEVEAPDLEQRRPAPSAHGPLGPSGGGLPLGPVGGGDLGGAVEGGDGAAEPAGRHEHDDEQDGGRPELVVAALEGGQHGRAQEVAAEGGGDRGDDARWGPPRRPGGSGAARAPCGGPSRPTCPPPRPRGPAPPCRGRRRRRRPGPRGGARRPASRERSTAPAGSG